MKIRQQATLYLPDSDAKEIEAIRSRFNPIQASLIRAHVTLCREDEVPDWGALQRRLCSIRKIAIEFAFDTVIREGDLVYATVRDEEPFRQLRHALLATESSQPRSHEPHLTLIHPRNATCNDDVFRELQSLFIPFKACCDTVTVIQQVDGGKWQDVYRHST